MNETKPSSILDSDLKALFETGGEESYCIGYGACASLEGSPTTKKLDAYKMIQTTIETNEIIPNPIRYIKFCPFSNNSKNEDDESMDAIHNYADHGAETGYLLFAKKRSILKHTVGAANSYS